MIPGVGGVSLGRGPELGVLFKHLDGPFVGLGGRCLLALRLGLGLSQLLIPGAESLLQDRSLSLELFVIRHFFVAINTLLG